MKYEYDLLILALQSLCPNINVSDLFPFGFREWDFCFGYYNFMGLALQSTNQTPTIFKKNK